MSGTSEFCNSEVREKKSEILKIKINVTILRWKRHNRALTCRPRPFFNGFYLDKTRTILQILKISLDSYSQLLAAKYMLLSIFFTIKP